MTAPRAAIVFNATTGSDTAASGLGPASAISGTAAAHTGGSASTTITLTNTPDLSGVQVGDLLWLKTASGRQFSVIASADNSAKTVTVDDSFTIAEASAVNYAIGGKRATFDDADSRCLQADVKPGWTLQTETDQTLNSVWAFAVAGDVAAGPVAIQGDSATALRTITQAANAACFGLALYYQKFSNLILKNSNGTKTAAHGFHMTNTASAIIRNCILGDPAGTNNLFRGFSRTAGTPNIVISLENCEVVNTTGIGLAFFANSPVNLLNCWVHGCGAGGVTFSGVANVFNCVIEGNTGVGVNLNTAQASVRCTVVHANTSHNIEATVVLTGGAIVNNQLTGSTGGYGLALHASQLASAYLVGNNNFGHASDSTANTSGGCNLTLDDTNVSVAAGYPDAANKNFGPGAAVQGIGYPGSGGKVGTAYTSSSMATLHYDDLGPVQHQAGGGSRAVIIGG